MNRAISLRTVTDAAFPLEIAPLSPGVLNAAQAAGTSSAKCSCSFFRVWNDLATGQVGSVAHAWHAAASAFRTQLGLLQRSLGYHCCCCWCLWAVLCEARWRCPRGLGSECVLQAGKAVQHLLLLLPICPPALTDALWVWRPWWLGLLPSDYWGSLEKSICRKMVVMQ